MLNTLTLMLVTTALSVVMLLVLTSLAGSKVVGIREWRQANALAVISLLLFASRGVLPDLLSLEAANALLLGSIALMYAGFCRHLGLPVPARKLVLGAVAAFTGLVYFHDVHESLALRISSVSAYHSAVCFAIQRCLPAKAEGRLHYPIAFTRVTALSLGCGHAFRGLFYAVDAYSPVTLVDPATANLVFVAIGTLALPGLTLGAVMMANARVIAEIAYAADHDHLTGAPLRRAFFGFAERELARAQRHSTSLGLLLVDADHFKRINDTHGHAVGDLVLRDLVVRTQEAIRKIDFCARLGGEEFAVMLPDTDRGTAESVADRLRAALACPAPGLPPYTVSIGLAMLEQGETLAGLMARADAALYAAKEGGRNRVVGAAGLAPEKVVRGAGSRAQA